MSHARTHSKRLWEIAHNTSSTINAFPVARLVLLMMCANIISVFVCYQNQARLSTATDRIFDNDIWSVWHRKQQNTNAIGYVRKAKSGTFPNKWKNKYLLQGLTLDLPPPPSPPPMFDGCHPHEAHRVRSSWPSPPLHLCLCWNHSYFRSRSVIDDVCWNRSNFRSRL